MKHLMLALLLLCQIARADQISQSAGNAFNEKELLIIDQLLNDEVKVFSTGGNTFLLGGDLTQASVSEIAKIYGENQIAGDQKFYQKKLHLTGQIAAIKSGLGNTPYLALKGTNPFLSPQAHFQNPNIDRLAKLKKGQTVVLVCEGAGVVIGIPAFKNCVFSDEYAKTGKEKVVTDLQKTLADGIAPNENIQRFLVVITTLARKLKPNSACYFKKPACLAEINKYHSNPKSQSDVAETISILTKQGIKITKRNPT